MPLEGGLIIIEILDDLQAIASGLMTVGEHLSEDVPGKGTQVAREGNATLSDHLEVAFHLHPLITGPTHQHLVKNDPQCPDIALFRVVVVDICFRCHVLRRSDVIEHLGFIRHFCHLAVTEIYNCDSFTDFWPRLKQYVVWLEVAMHNSLTSNLFVALKDLPEDQNRFLFWESIGRAFHVLRQRSSLEKFSDKVYVVLLDDHIEQSHYVFMSGVIDLAQIAESCNLTAQQVSGDLVIDLTEVDGLDSYFDLRGSQQEAQIDVTCGAFPQEL